MKALFRRQEMICGAMSCSAFSGVQLFSIWGLRIPDVFRESSRTNHQWCQWYLVRIRIIHKIQTTNAYYYCYIYNTVIVLIYHDILILKYHHALHTWIWYYLCIYIYTVLYTYTCYYGYTNTCCSWIIPLICIGTPLIFPFSAVRGVVKTSTRWTKVSSFDETNRPKVFRPSIDMLRGFFKSWEIPNSPCFSF